jgi:sodium-dependent lysophosphatidylcholine symporter 1
MPSCKTIISIFCFTIAGLPFQLMYSAIGVFATKFLLDEAQIDAKLTSIILFTSRAVDAFKDPLIGYLVNITPVTKWGKLKPW